MKHRIVIGILAGILALALMVLAVPLHYLAVLASPLGSSEATYQASMWEFEQDTTGCGDWRHPEDYFLTWAEAVSPTYFTSCVSHVTALTSVGEAWFGMLRQGSYAPDGHNPWTAVNRILLQWDTSALPDSALIKSAKVRLIYN